MRAIRDHAAEPLTWMQPRALARAYELRAGKVLLGSLRWERVFSSLATAECAGGKWTFERSGFLRTRIKVRSADSGADLAAFEWTWTGAGSLSVEGRRYTWSKTGFWRSSWAFSRESGKPVIGITSRCKWMRWHAESRVESRASSLRDLELLVLLSGYLVVLHSDEAAGAAAIACASV